MNRKLYNKKTKIIWKGFILRLAFLFLLVCLSLAGYFGYKFYNLEKKIVQEAEQVPETKNKNEENDSTLIEATKNIITQNRKELKGEKRGRINILLLGMGGDGHSGKYLTDTIMLASINPETYQSAFLSIPRDLYVEIPNTGIHTKINAVYAYELRNEAKNSGQSMFKLKQLIKEITGQEVDYYIALDFEGFKKIIDELGGINIEVEEDIYDSRYPGPNYSYETFEINKGFHHLDGKVALKYSRVRHTAGGDFGRARRQQQVLAAAKKKAFSVQGFANPMHLNSLIEILGQHLRTDIHFVEIPSFVDLARNINIYQTTNKVLDAWSEDSLLASSHTPLGGVMAYTLIPRAKNYSQIHELAENIFDLNLLERKKQEIEKEAAEISVITQDSSNYYKIKNILRKLGYQIRVERNRIENVNCREKTKIYNNNQQNPKIFTLDDLNAKLEGEVIDQKIVEAEEDIVICISPDLFDYFQAQNSKEEEKEELKEKSVISEKGEILINKK